jgi:SpoVK/Ycf46/Vps4 family AAA+-type ATPase
VLWIDEIEKGLAGAGGNSDGGVSTRVLGHFLFWLQEGKARVFVVSTANDVSRLPPELFRRGRFDELFFVDLPSPDERREILSLYAGKYLHTQIADELLDELVGLSEGFAGSDLDAAVAEIAKTEALREVTRDRTVVDDQFWRRVFANIVPLSKTNPEAVEAIRGWGRERAVPASGTPASADGQPRSRRTVLV